MIEVILKEHVEHLGERGDVVKVAPGYARNYLLPRQLALAVTAGNKKQIEHEKKVAAAKAAEERAVAQALRWNPLPIAVPCHRVVGSDGTLTGYAGNQVGLKNRLLVLEGVHTAIRGRVPRVDRRANYVLTRGEREYCLPTCESIGSASLARLLLFGSREHAESAGYVPCTSCRPDLHPLHPRLHTSHPPGS